MSKQYFKIFGNELRIPAYHEHISINAHEPEKDSYFHPVTIKPTDREETDDEKINRHDQLEKQMDCEAIITRYKSGFRIKFSPEASYQNMLGRNYVANVYFNSEFTRKVRVKSKLTGRPMSERVVKTSVRDKLQDFFSSVKKGKESFIHLEKLEIDDEEYELNISIRENSNYFDGPENRIIEMSVSLWKGNNKDYDYETGKLRDYYTTMYFDAKHSEEFINFIYFKDSPDDGNPEKKNNTPMPQASHKLAKASNRAPAGTAVLRKVKRRINSLKISQEL